jgi:hypothetical protein
MVRVVTLAGDVSIYLNMNDHSPAHVHVDCPEGEFKLLIETGELWRVRYGNATKARGSLRRAGDWVRLHRGELQELWDRRFL